MNNFIKLTISFLVIHFIIAFNCLAYASITNKKDVIDRDRDYGYSKNNPIKVGGFSEGNGAKNEHKYLNRLRGPTGDKVKYFRVGSCCSFETSKSPFGTGFLDKYRITYDGSDGEIFLYFDFYEEEPLRTPKGFTLDLEN